QKSASPLAISDSDFFSTLYSFPSILFAPHHYKHSHRTIHTERIVYLKNSKRRFCKEGDIDSKKNPTLTSTTNYTFDICSRDLLSYARLIMVFYAVVSAVKDRQQADH
ncbi:hypothetical protein Tcan_00951, partial [Toxocara canis]